MAQKIDWMKLTQEETVEEIVSGLENLPEDMVYDLIKRIATDVVDLDEVRLGLDQLADDLKKQIEDMR